MRAIVLIVLCVENVHGFLHGSLEIYPTVLFLEAGIEAVSLAIVSLTERVYYSGRCSDRCQELQLRL